MQFRQGNRDAMLLAPLSEMGYVSMVVTPNIERPLFCRPLGLYEGDARLIEGAQDALIVGIPFDA